MDGIDIQDIKKKYEDRLDIWLETDPWHYYTYTAIATFIDDQINRFNISSSIDVINIGSGGNPYSFEEQNMLHVDIVSKNIKNKPHSLIANVEKIDVPDNSFDCCLCVGSVINYADALLSIKEITRILKPGGYCFLEFENSKSFEFYGTKDYNQSATVVETFYQGEKEKLWVYSESYIKQMLNSFQCKILKTKRLHIISPLVYRISKDSKRSAHFYKIDKLMSFIPRISHNASNIIILAQKALF